MRLVYGARMQRLGVLGPMLGLALSLGCGDEARPLGDAGTLDAGLPDDSGLADAGPMPGALVPNFSLVDVNSTSPTGGTEVSPRDFLEKVSGWYFTHAS